MDGKHLIATIAGFAIYGALKFTIGIRMSQEAFDGADRSIHRIKANPELP